MKTHLSYIIAVGMFLMAVVTSCNKEKDDEKVMTMTTNASGVTINLAGTGSAIVNWGDGSESDTLMLNATFRHIYSEKNTHTIRKYGDGITGLDCSNIQLTNLDVSKNVVLTQLICRDNQLTVLDVSKNTSLELLGCSNNFLKKLDVRKNKVLVGLSCDKNQITSLDLSNNTVLWFAECQYNQFTDKALDALFGTLHSNSILGITKAIVIQNNPGAATCNPSIAVDKGWTVY